jgi:hypothetical protein
MIMLNAAAISPTPETITPIFPPGAMVAMPSRFMKWKAPNTAKGRANRYLPKLRIAFIVGQFLRVMKIGVDTIVLAKIASV